MTNKDPTLRWNCVRLPGSDFKSFKVKPEEMHAKNVENWFMSTGLGVKEMSSMIHLTFDDKEFIPFEFVLSFTCHCITLPTQSEPGSSEEEHGREVSRLQKQLDKKRAASVASIVFYFNLLEIMRQITIVGCAANDIGTKDISIYPFVFNPVTQIPFSQKEITMFTERMQAATKEHELRMKSETLTNQMAVAIGAAGVVASSLAVGLGVAASMPTILNAAPAAVVSSIPVIVANTLAASEFVTSNIPTISAKLLSMFALSAFSTKTAIEASNLITTGNNSTVFQKLSECTKIMNGTEWQRKCNKPDNKKSCKEQIKKCNAIRKQRNNILSDLGHKAYEVALYAAVTVTIPEQTKDFVKYVSNFEYIFVPTLNAPEAAYKLGSKALEQGSKALEQVMQYIRQLLAGAGYEKLALTLKEWKANGDSFSLALNTKIIADEVNYREILPFTKLLSFSDSDLCQKIKVRNWVGETTSLTAIPRSLKNLARLEIVKQAFIDREKKAFIDREKQAFIDREKEEASNGVE
jgi:hypothetical protein